MTEQAPEQEAQQQVSLAEYISGSVNAVRAAAIARQEYRNKPKKNSDKPNYDRDVEIEALLAQTMCLQAIGIALIDVSTNLANVAAFLQQTLPHTHDDAPEQLELPTE